MKRGADWVNNHYSHLPVEGVDVDTGQARLQPSQSSKSGKKCQNQARKHKCCSNLLNIGCGFLFCYTVSVKSLWYIHLDSCIAPSPSFALPVSPPFVRRNCSVGQDEDSSLHSASSRSQKTQFYSPQVAALMAPPGDPNGLPNSLPTIYLLISHKLNSAFDILGNGNYFTKLVIGWLWFYFVQHNNPSLLKLLYLFCMCVFIHICIIHRKFQ